MSKQRFFHRDLSQRMRNGKEKHKRVDEIVRIEGLIVSGLVILEGSKDGQIIANERTAVLRVRVAQRKIHREERKWSPSSSCLEVKKYYGRILDEKRFERGSQGNVGEDEMWQHGKNGQQGIQEHRVSHMNSFHPLNMRVGVQIVGVQ